MLTMKVTAKAGSDGCLRIVVPAVPGVEYEVVLVLEMNVPVPASQGPTTPEDRGWPPGHFESLFGSIQDESFVAPVRTQPQPAEPQL